MLKTLFKPMLAGSIKPPFALSPDRFPLLVSPKLDGVRATVQGGVLMARSLKPITNAHVQSLFARPEFEGLDGELIVGDPTAPNAFRRTASEVLSEKGKPNAKFYVFDCFDSHLGFAGRLAKAKAMIDASSLESHQIELVPHLSVKGPSEMLEFEAVWVAQGFEGTMVRSMSGPYKQGRSTANEGYLLKLKRFEDAEGEVLDVMEMMHNDNPAVVNELGKLERSSHKENKRPAGMMGALVVKNLQTGVTHKVSPGNLTTVELIAIWQQKEQYVGRIAKFKFFASGSKDKPRFTQFQGWRDPRDMESL